MLPHLLDVSIRSLVLALIAVAFLAMPRRRRTAALEHAVWTTVVCGMLALFSFSQLLPPLPLRILSSPATLQVTPRTAAAETPAIDPVFEQTPAPASTAARPLSWQDVLLWTYLAVAFAFLIHFATGIWLARRLLAHAGPTPLGAGVFESSSVAVPVAIGSKTLLPLDWRDWDRAKLDAVLAHEGAHVRRHDSLIAALAGLNRCVLWFHPLAWILEHRLSFLADQACDDASVAELNDRDAYARVLLEMATRVHQGRLSPHALTMAAPSHIRQRIDALLDDRRTFSRGLTRTAWASILLCAIPLVLFAGIAKLDRKPPVLSMQLPQPSVPAPPLIDSNRAPIQIAQAVTPPSTPLATITPRFDDVSIKPCASGDGAGRSGRGGAQGRGIPPSPAGEIYIHCLSVREILNISVNQGGIHLLNDPGWANDPQRIQGGPPWISTDLWTIDAKTTDPTASQWTFFPQTPESRVIRGAMMIAMVEDRFHVQMHHKTEDVPMYALTLMPGGTKLQPAEAGSCINHEPGTPLTSADTNRPDGKPLCLFMMTFDGPNVKADGYSLNSAQIAGALSGASQLPVLDKTGLTGVYNLHLKFDPASLRLPPPAHSPFTAPTADDPLAPPLNTVIEQQLGLTLVDDKGPREFIVIDSAQRP